MKTMATDGRSGFCKELPEVTKATANFAGGFGLIKEKAATASYFDTLRDAAVSKGEVLPIGAVVKVPAWESAAASPLAEGDIFIPIDMSASCWTTDVAAGAQEGSVDLTTQCDVIAGKKDVQGDGNITDTGTINGLFRTDSPMQRTLEGLFRPRIVDDGSGKVTFIARQKNQTFWHWFTYREMTEVGETEITLFRRMRIAQISQGQPASGGVPFNFNYETQETYQYEEVIST